MERDRVGERRGSGGGGHHISVTVLLWHVLGCSEKSLHAKLCRGMNETLFVCWLWILTHVHILTMFTS